MDTRHFLLVPGAGGAAHVWHRVVAELERRGHVGVAVDLPADDVEAGLEAYADVALAAATAYDGGRGASYAWSVVGQSMGALTAPLLVGRLDVAALVLLNPMVPAPGESGAEWWRATGQGPAAMAAAEEGGYPSGFDPAVVFLHDLDPATAAALEEHEREESDAAFDEPWPLTAWPDVPTRVLAGTDDRLFPPAFQERVARERLGVTAERVPGGHLNSLSRPVEVVDALLA